MKKSVFVFLSFLSLQVAADTVKSGKFCSDDKSLCINALLFVDSSKGVVELNGRVARSTRPGFLRITLHGYSETQIYKAFVQGRLKGKYSEVIDFKNGASHSSDAVWKIKRFEYLPLE
jgi:hypothetical protein